MRSVRDVRDYNGVHPSGILCKSPPDGSLECGQTHDIRRAGVSGMTVMHGILIHLIVVGRIVGIEHPHGVKSSLRRNNACQDDTNGQTSHSSGHEDLL